MKQVDVAVGVVHRIVDDKRQFFICRRNASQHQGNKWEFPGGKVDLGETPLEALKRELKEEIGISVFRADSLIDIVFDYPDKSVCLYAFLADEFSGEAIGAEGQESRWVDSKELSSYTFPDANIAILDILSEKGLL